MSEFDVIGFGALNVDQFFQVEEFIGDDEIAVQAKGELPGGSAANTIYGLAKLGLRCGFLGALGEDEGGKMLLKDFESVGVDISQIRLKREAKTGLVLSLIDKRGKRALYVSPGANNLLKKEDLDLKYVNRANLVHFTSLVADEGLELQKWLSKNLSGKVKMSFSPGAIYTRKGLEAILPLIRRADVLFLNEKEVKRLTGKEFREGSQTLLNLGCRAVAVTLGPRGCYVCKATEEHKIESKKLKALDTTGAGDAFATGFLYGFLTGKDLRTCGFMGNLVASFCLSEFGARSGLPDLNQLKELIERVSPE